MSREQEPLLASESGSLEAAQPVPHTRSSPLLRTVLTSVFVLFMLAAAHLLMVAINAVEVKVDPPRPAEGLSARMFNDRPIAEELDAALLKAHTPEKRQVLQAALSKVKAGEPLELHTLPVTGFLVYMTLGLTLLGVLLMWTTSRIKSDAAQSIVGIFAGNLMWTGVEYGLTIAARTLGIAKAVGVYDGQVVAIYGEYTLMKHTWGVMALIFGYLLFLESSRCPIFLWWRKAVPTMRGPIVSGRIDNYGPRSAFQYATTVWGFYLLLLWAYDDRVFGVHGYFTKATLFFSIAGGFYTLYRLYQQPSWGTAIRYAVGAMIIVWTPIEIVGKWGLLREPWLILRPDMAVTFFGGLVLGTIWLWRAQRKPAKPVVKAPAFARDGSTIPPAVA